MEEVIITKEILDFIESQKPLSYDEIQIVEIIVEKIKELSYEP